MFFINHFCISIVQHLHDLPTTVVRRSCDFYEEILYRSNMKNYRNYIMRASYECLANITRLSRGIYANFTRARTEICQWFVRVLCDCRIYDKITISSETQYNWKFVIMKHYAPNTLFPRGNYFKTSYNYFSSYLDCKWQ